MTEALDIRSAEVSHPTLLGHHPVAALWWPAGWQGEAARQRDMLAAWTAGASLHRFAEGDLLCLPQPRAMDCDRLSAWPLRRVAGALCSAAIEPAALAGRATADVWLAEGGRLRPLQLAAAEAVDPSTWLQVDVPLLQPLDLRLPEPPRELVAQPKELHDILGPGIPREPSPEARRLLQALRDAPARAASSSGRSAAQPAIGARLGKLLLVALAIGLVILVLALLFGSETSLTPRLWWLLPLLYFARRGWRDSDEGAAPSRPLPSAAKATAPGLRQRLTRSRVVPQRWREWAARLAITSGLSRLLGAQHAAYMRRMLAMFDEGRLDEALRHAIPLGGESLGQAFGRLGPRQDLRLGERGGAATSVDFGADLEAHLRSLYRRSAQQLETAGRIDEAVFVLAELLKSRQEALDLLERHGRAADAAELAFRWDMPPAQIVRLYALAGDWKKAVLVARRDGAFAAAVDLLQARWPQAAAQLRLAWAEALTANGRWLEAVQVIWPLRVEHGRAAPWLDVAEAAGGGQGVRALAWRAQVWPDSLPTRSALIEALQGDADLQAERWALAEELLQLPTPPTPAARRLAALIVGPLMADQAGPRPLPLDTARLRQLVTLAGDAALSADLPPLAADPAARPLESRQQALEAELPPVGLQAIVDAIPLADGELLLALGEGGVVRLDARGRRLAHFAVPAQRLIAADDGGIALALARREVVWRVSRLELARGRWSDLGLHRFDTFADGFDGVGWSVGIGNRVEVLDVQSPGLRDVLWRVADLPGPVVQIDRGDVRERWLLAPPSEQIPAQQWTYLLQGRRLQSREEVPPTDGNTLGRAFVHGRGLVDLITVSGTETETRVRAREIAPGGPAGGEIVLSGAEVLKGGGDWFVLSRFDGEHDLLELAHWHSGLVHARWRWPEQDEPQMRQHRGRWLVFDARGRVAVLDTRSSHLRGVSVR